MINEILQCDFCSMPGPVWRYPARSFIAYCAPIAAAAVLYEDLAELHQQFFAHRSGTAVPITAHAA